MREDGTRIDLSLTISPVKDGTGNIVGASKVARDISLRKQAEQANNLLAAVVDSSDDAIITKRLDGVITSWNKSAERLLGHTREEAIGMHLFLIIPEERRDEEADLSVGYRTARRLLVRSKNTRRQGGGILDITTQEACGHQICQEAVNRTPRQPRDGYQLFRRESPGESQKPQPALKRANVVIASRAYVHKD